MTTTATSIPIPLEKTMTYATSCTPLTSIKEQEEEEDTKDTTIIVVEVNSPQFASGTTVVAPTPTSTSTSATPGSPLSLLSLSLTDDELWEPWFSFPSQRGLTLLRWAGERKSELLAYTKSLDPSSSMTISQYHKFQSLSRQTNSSYKLLILGSILLIRGVSHGTLMGRMLFGRLLGERMADVMFLTATTATATGEGQGQGGMRKGIFENRMLLERSILEAKGYHSRAAELYSMGKYAAALEHLALAMMKLVPWDGASLPTLSVDPLTKSYMDLDLLIILSIAKTSSSLSTTLSPSNQLISSNSGSRLYRLSHAACEAVRLYPYPYPPLSSLKKEKEEAMAIGGLPTPPPSPISPISISVLNRNTEEEEKQHLDPLDLADILDKNAEKIAHVTTIESIKLPNKDKNTSNSISEGYISPRQVRRAWDNQ